MIWSSWLSLGLLVPWKHCSYVGPLVRITGVGATSTDTGRGGGADTSTDKGLDP